MVVVPSSYNTITEDELESSKNILLTALNIGISSSRIYELFGLTYEKMQDLQNAKLYYQKSLEIDHKNECRQNLISILINEGLLEEAIENLEIYAEQMPGRQQTFFDLACIHANYNNLELFEKNMIKVMSISEVKKQQVDECKFFDSIRKKEVFIQLYEQLPD